MPPSMGIWVLLPLSRGSPLSQGTVGEVCGARRSGNHVVSRTRIRQLPTARPARPPHLHPPHDFPALSASAVRREYCRTRCLVVPTSAVLVDRRVLVLLPRPGPDSRQHAQHGLPPAPEVGRAPPDHTHGSSPTSGGDPPLPPVLFVAASSCRSVKTRRPAPEALCPRTQHRPPRLPRVCSHRRRLRAGRKASVPVHRASHSSTESCCAGFADVRVHLAHCWSRAASAALNEPGVLVGGGA